MGNLILKETPKKRTHYTYDDYHRLIQVEDEDQVVQYSYDTLGRRKTKQVWMAGEQVLAEHYLYHQHREVAALNLDGSVKAFRILHPQREETLAIELNGNVYIPLQNQQNNLKELIDPKTGTSVCSYTISPFGDSIEYTPHIENAPLSPWVFSGKRLDPETNLFYFGHRYYDPTIRRWLSPDPLGPINGNNLYTYARNNPLRYFDPDGRFAIVLPLCYYVGGVGFSFVSLSALTEIALWSATACLGYYTVDYLNEKIQQGQSSPPPSTSLQPLGNLPGYGTGKLLEECARQDLITKPILTGVALEAYNEALPENPDDLLKRGYEETTHSKAARAGHRTFVNPDTGDEVRFDKGKSNEPGHRGEDHYHRTNPHTRGKADRYLDAQGRPCPKNSPQSHLLPGG